MKICVATGTRAEYGLLKPLIDKIQAESGFILQVLVTGAHLSPEFGLTYRQIEKDNIKIDAKVEMLLSSDTPEGIAKSMGIGMIGYADAFKNLNPDLLVILGDRYEMLALASAALIFKIPIVHINGGDITEGAYDDAIRHSLTKMSHLHFASADEYMKRVIQMGEQPEFVFNVGAIGLDNIKNLPLLNKEETENTLGINFKKYNYLIAFHPETLSSDNVETQFLNLLEAIDMQEESFFVFTKANADTDGRVINKIIEDFTAKNPHKSKLFDSLGTVNFLSVMKHADAIVGNSSSGIVEAPSLKTATINIGNRQKGRLQAGSILNCKAKTDEILTCFEKIKTADFKKVIAEAVNPYGSGDTSVQIIDTLKKVNIENLRLKKFYTI